MREIEDKIRALSQQMGEDADPDAWIFAQVEQGFSFTRIARKLGTSRQMLDKWIKLVPGRKERLNEAKRESAHALIDSAAEDLERLARKAKTQRIESAEVQLVNSQVNFKKWLAGQRNDEYKEVQRVDVQTSGDLHFLLLQRFGSLPKKNTPALPESELPVLPAQVADEEQEYAERMQRLSYEAEDRAEAGERDDISDLFD